MKTAFRSLLSKPRDNSSQWVVCSRQPSDIVRTVKSITAREMWEQHKSYLQRYLWGGGFWEQSYYIGTAGHVSSKTITRYIERTEHV